MAFASIDSSSERCLAEAFDSWLPARSNELRFLRFPRVNIQLVKPPTASATNGKSVDMITANTALMNPCGSCPPNLVKYSNRSSPITTASPANATPNTANQILGWRLVGKDQTTNNMPGTKIDIQTKCIDTNASVGGSQPHAPQNRCISGMFTEPNNVDP